jgi:diacylglycerol kinase (ATP)
MAFWEQSLLPNMRSPSAVPQRKVADVHWRSSRAIGSTLKRIFSATDNSLRGLLYGVKTEAAIRDEAVLVAVALPLGVVLAPSPAWYVAMIGGLLIVLAVEFLNTAIEKLADYVTREQHVDIGRIKDFGSAAVFCGLCLTGLVWLAAIAVRFGLF